MKKLIAVTIIVLMGCIMMLAGCGATDNTSDGVKIYVTENHIKAKVIDNFSIDADVPDCNIEKCSAYDASAQAIDAEAAADLLLGGKNVAEHNKNENNGAEWFYTSDGAKLMLTNISATYTRSEDMWNYYNLITSVYADKLSFYIDHRDNLNECENSDMVQQTTESIKNLCTFSDGQAITLSSAVKVSHEELMIAQTKMIDDGTLLDDIRTGNSTAVYESLGEDCFFLQYEISSDGIPYAGICEPDVAAADGVNVLQSAIEVIVSEKGVLFFYAQGLFNTDAPDTVSLISVNDAAEIVATQYENIILPYECVCDKIWLEYMFVQTPGSEYDSMTGTLQPYWCFQIRQEDEDGVQYSAERINAVTGENFLYEN